MLTIIIPGKEHWDEQTELFVTVGDVKLELEHSLVSLSKWESIYEKPFMDKVTKSNEEMFDYIKAMILDPEISPEVIFGLTKDNLSDINTYIGAKMSATWFSEIGQGPPNREVVTSELIYYWMISYTIPIECENWHLNRLLTLIRVFNLKNNKPKKLTQSELAARYRELNERRKAQLGTEG